MSTEKQFHPPFFSIFEVTFKRTLKIYLIALSILLGLIASGYILERRILKKQKDFAYIINNSGRQRMLSQRIAVFVGKPKSNKTQEKLRADLRELTTILNYFSKYDSNNYLTELNTANIQKTMDANKFLLNDFLSSVDNYSRNNLENQKEAAKIQELALSPILKLFDDLTNAREFEVNRFITRIDELKNIIFFITIALIVLEAIFIFYPLAKNNFSQSLMIMNQREVEDKIEKNKNFIKLGEAFSRIIHEINNPLTIVMMKVFILKKHLRQDTESIHSLESIHKNLLRVTDIIKCTKSIYRDSSNDNVSSVKLQQVINEAKDAVNIIKDIQNLILEIRIYDDVIVKMKEHQIFQVIINLLLNAIDAVEYQQIKKIIIELLIDNNDVLIRVSDNGPGVPAGFDEKIFEKLFTTKNLGTGIGLYESKIIIESYAGKIRLNREHSNSCFEIILPETIIEQNLDDNGPNFHHSFLAEVIAEKTFH